MSLHRRLNQMVESLEADLDGQVDNDLLVQDLMSFAGDAASLESRIAALTVELERSRYKGCGSYPRAIGEIESRLGIVGNPPLGEVVEAVRKLVTDLATERAAREQAEADRELLRGAAKTFETACSRAELERDTALARVKELEAERVAREQAQETAKDCARVVEHFRGERDTALAQRDDARRRYYTEAQTRIAAETALASARSVIEEAYHYQNRMPTDFVLRARSWLTSHPAPVAAPCAGCAAARELLVLWYHNRAETESGELIEVATQNWLKEHGNG